MTNTRKIYSFALFSKLLFELIIWMLFLKSIGWSIFEIGILQAIINFTQFFTEVPSGYLSDRYGRKNILALGQVFVILYIGSFFFAATAHWVVYLGFFFYGLGLSLLSGADESLIYDNMADKRYAAVFGRYNAIAITAIAVSSLLGGYLAEISWSLVFIATGIAQVIALIVILTFDETNRPNVDAASRPDLRTFIRDIKTYVHPNESGLFKTDAGDCPNARNDLNSVSIWESIPR